MGTTKDQELARKRATVIMQVRSGKLTAQQGATVLGVSRKTYYEWEHRALEAMVSAMANSESGRPAQTVDPEKESLKGQVKELEQKLVVAQETEEVRNMLRAMDEHRERKGKKGARRKKKR